MRLIRVVILFIFIPFFSGIAQTPPEEVNLVNKYLLSARGPSGELIITTGRIVKAIALSRPQSMEIAHIWVNYSVSIKLVSDRDGSTTAQISFRNLHLTGDVKYKGFDITDFIFPSCVSFKLYPSGSGRAKPLLASVKEATINPGNCTISVSLGKNVTEIPVIDKLCFFHSDTDYETANGQIQLVERYFTATWLMKRMDQLMDAMQFSQLNNPPAFVASTVEVALLNDWITRQRFDKYHYFQKIDSLMFTKQLQVNRFKRKLIQQDFVKANSISWDDLSKSAALFSESLANYFDAGQADINRSAYLTQMAGSSMTNIGYKALLDFIEIYNTAHPRRKISQREIVAFSELIEKAMIRHAAKLVESDQYSEAMNMLKTSDRYSLLLVDQQSPFEKELTRNLCQRLYKYYLDISVKAMQGDVFRVSTDYYRKALSVKNQYPSLVHSDQRERYIADMTCKNIIQTAERSLKSNDIAYALSEYEEVIKIADSARLRVPYELARTRLQAISGRPSGFKPWTGNDLAVVVPKDEPEVIMDKPVKLGGAKKEAVEPKRKAIAEPVINTMTQTNNTDSKTVLAGKDKQPASARRKMNAVKDDTWRPVSTVRTQPDRFTKERNQKNTNSKFRTANKSRMNIESANIQDAREKLKEYVKNIHLKIWSGDVDSSLFMLKRADSLQSILSKSGDEGYLVDLKTLRVSYDNLVCDQQKTIYNKDLEKIKFLLKQKDFSQASVQLKLLIDKPFIAECAIDKSGAHQLLGTLDAPITFKKWTYRLDSLTAIGEPEAIMEAYGKANDYYRSNGLDQWGMPAPDLLPALLSRKEAPFLLKASQQFVNNHQPAYALTLLKSVLELEPNPDKTLLLQKEVGEMLAAGDYAPEKNVSEKLNGYSLNERWFTTLIKAYKKQWKLFAK